MKVFRALCLAALLVAAALPLGAETNAPPPPDHDPFAAYLFPPERVMSHAAELGLEDGQKAAIKAEVQKVQGKFVDLQFDMQSESEKMVRLLQERPVDETRVLAEVDRILGIEKEVRDNAETWGLTVPEWKPNWEMVPEDSVIPG